MKYLCRGNVSITYREAAYEKSWETHRCATVIGILYGDSGGVRQSSAAPSRRTTATP
ncbi:hypothetical protein D3C85_1857710 [compost metagenome]